MARTVAELPAGARITDYISMAVISKAIPGQAIGTVLARATAFSILLFTETGMPSGFFLEKKPHCTIDIMSIEKN